MVIATLETEASAALIFLQIRNVHEGDWQLDLTETGVIGTRLDVG
jgi:hypothetical protein